MIEEEYAAWWRSWWTDPEERETCVLCEDPTEGHGDSYGRCADCCAGNEVKVGLTVGAAQKEAAKVANTIEKGADRLDSRSCLVCGKRGHTSCPGVCGRAVALSNHFARRRQLELDGKPAQAQAMQADLCNEVHQFERVSASFRQRSEARRAKRKRGLRWLIDQNE